MIECEKSHIVMDDEVIRLRVMVRVLSAMDHHERRRAMRYLWNRFWRVEDENDEASA